MIVNHTATLKHVSRPLPFMLNSPTAVNRQLYQIKCSIVTDADNSSLSSTSINQKRIRVTKVTNVTARPLLQSIYNNRTGFDLASDRPYLVQPARSTPFPLTRLPSGWGRGADTAVYPTTAATHHSNLKQLMIPQAINYSSSRQASATWCDLATLWTLQAQVGLCFVHVGFDTQTFSRVALLTHKLHVGYLFTQVWTSTVVVIRKAYCSRSSCKLTCMESNTNSISSARLHRLDQRQHRSETSED